MTGGKRDGMTGWDEDWDEVWDERVMDDGMG